MRSNKKGYGGGDDREESDGFEGEEGNDSVEETKKMDCRSNGKGYGGGEDTFRVFPCLREPRHILIFLLPQHYLSLIHI